MQPSTLFPGARRAFRRDAIDAIKGALKSLDGDCRDDPSAPVFCYTCCPDDYDAHFPEQKSSLIDALQYELDTLVVLDSFFLRVHRIREEVCFVTADNVHILRNHDRIEEILPGIIVRGPDSFLAGEGGWPIPGRSSGEERSGRARWKLHRCPVRLFPGY